MGRGADDVGHLPSILGDDEEAGITGSPPAWASH